MSLPQGTTDLIIEGSEPPYDCWKLNSELLEEQPVLLIAESLSHLSISME